MLKIRLQRIGAKHQPTFRLVVTDRRAGPKSGRNVEVLGSYDARRQPRMQLKEERVKHWLEQGAQASDTVYNHLVDAKLIKGKKVNVLPKKQPLVSEADKAEATDKKPGDSNEKEPVKADSVVKEESAVEGSKEESVQESQTEEIVEETVADKGQEVEAEPEPAAKAEGEAAVEEGEKDTK